MLKEYKPYTYLIGWSQRQKYYYGAEYGNIIKTANPDNLWKEYFTSSKHVTEMRKLFGEPDIIEIRKIFNNRDDCINWEKKVLVKMRVIHSDIWLNHRANAGIRMTEEIRNKIGAANKGKSHKHTEITKRKIGRSAKERFKNKLNHPKYGTKISDKHKEKIAMSNKTRIVSEETRLKIGNANKTRIVSEETRLKMRLARLGKKFK